MSVITAARIGDDVAISSDGLRTARHAIAWPSETSKWIVSADGLLAMGLVGDGSIREILGLRKDELFGSPEPNEIVKSAKDILLDYKGYRPIENEQEVLPAYTDGAVIVARGYSERRDFDAGIWVVSCCLVEAEEVDIALESCAGTTINQRVRRIAFASLGAGEDFARGAMLVTVKYRNQIDNITASLLAEEGVLAGCNFSLYCGGTVLTQKLQDREGC